MAYYQKISGGSPKPIGVVAFDKGVNFSIFSAHANKVVLCLIDPISKQIVEEIPVLHKTGYMWHVFLEGLTLPILYAYKMDGNKTDPNFYDENNLLLDPYAQIIDSPTSWGDKTKKYHPYGVIKKEEEFSWEGIENPYLPLKDLIIYEMHVRGFTQDPSSNVKNKGTFLGIIEKIPYLKELGVNAVELMPVFEFNENENDKLNPETKGPLCNFWGYSTTHFFTPMNRYAVSGDLGESVVEFKKMVKELHRNQIEVILDVVLNHTGEKKDKGITISFLGIDRAIYYLLDHDKDTNFTGCGNTVNMNHPVVQQFVKDVLHHWVVDMKVDGFRFDLACIMNRDMQGHIVHISALLQQLTHDPILAKTKLIAEPWDAAGAYQLGGFHPKLSRWSEWNGKYRDGVRRFMKGDKWSKNVFADNLCGSKSIFPFRTPQASINFITAHDGFSLHDLVSYNQKHNLSNGENNQDGNNDNASWNCGAEGATDSSGIIGLRNRQMRNFMLALMISQGVPMILMGDEYAHTKKGNNNSWCHDDSLNYFLWNELDKNKEFYRFVKHMIAFRKNHPLLRQEHFLSEKDIIWHGAVPNTPKWEKDDAVLGFTLIDHSLGQNLYAMFNATNHTVNIEIPAPPKDKHWHLVVDTFAQPPNDYLEEEKKIQDLKYSLNAYSSILLKAL